MSLNSDRAFMNRALELAAKGLRITSPNPMVGAVIVRDGEIVGEGYHKLYGGDHAEVEAFRSLKDPTLAVGATLYVTLEPCCHFGKTPPCCDEVIKRGVKRVVCSNQDPNPIVAGKGFDKLRASGIEVTLGICAEQGREVNKRFFTRHNLARPYVILKWAQTSDGFIARSDGSSKWISCEESRRLVHSWRAEEDSIMVGTNTVVCDNPELTVRAVNGLNPKRVILDRNLRLAESYKVLSDGNPTVLITAQKDSHIRAKSVEIVAIEPYELTYILRYLANRGINSIFVEGGAQVIRSFIEDDLWDEARIFSADKVSFGSGISAPIIKRSHNLQEKKERSGDDSLSTIFNRSI